MNVTGQSGQASVLKWAAMRGTAGRVFGSHRWCAPTGVSETRLQVKFLIASFSLTEPTYLASNARIP